MRYASHQGTVRQSAAVRFLMGCLEDLSKWAERGGDLRFHNSACLVFFEDTFTGELPCGGEGGRVHLFRN